MLRVIEETIEAIDRKLSFLANDREKRKNHETLDEACCRLLLGTDEEKFLRDIGHEIRHVQYATTKLNQLCGYKETPEINSQKYFYLVGLFLHIRIFLDIINIRNENDSSCLESFKLVNG